MQIFGRVCTSSWAQNGRVNQPPSEPTDHLMHWFERNYRAAALTSRTAANMAAQMDGALTTGQAATRDIGIGACLKYELDDGFLERLTQFRLDSLTADQIGGSDQLGEIAESVSVATEFIHEHRRRLVRSTYREQSMVIEAMKHLERVASSIDSLINDCIARLIERGG